MSVSVTFLKGVKGKRRQQLNELGVETVDDLVRLMPRYYEDRSGIRSCSELSDGAGATVKVRIMRISFRQINRSRSVLNLLCEDDTGRIGISFFNQRYIRDRFEKGQEALFFGKVVRGYRGGLEMVNPEFVLPEDGVMLTDGEIKGFSGVYPVYPLTKGLSQKMLRKFIGEALSLVPEFADPLPESIKKEYSLIRLNDAIRRVHRPETVGDAEEARRRLAFDELLGTRLMLLLMKQSYAGGAGGNRFNDEPLTPALRKLLPFELTDSQEAVWRDIQADMAVNRPMNRLVMGDVGSGKTVLAMLAILRAAGNGFQSAYMAPTEVLAEQHYANIAPVFGKLGVSCALLTGAVTGKNRAEILERIADGTLLCVIGTHALIQRGVSWNRLGLAVTDEQHRFGVRQRGMFFEKSKGSAVPDILVMTATPIPRTLGMILYGDMDISRVETLPTGRKPIQTYLDDGRRRERIYRWAAELARQGRQIYIVHAAIGDEKGADGADGEEAEEDAGVTTDVLSATDNFAEASGTYFSGLTTALLHGRLPDREKNDIMRRFAGGEISVLFSTTVIEVGVDVANACLMIIENSERFGLSQLHQLRGRVGRGSEQSYCVLLTTHHINPDPPDDDLVSRRLLTLRDCLSGEKIAEEDLRLRGPGDFFGVSQHGLPAFHAANLYTDGKLLEITENIAARIASAPENSEYSEYIDHVRKRMPEAAVL